MIKLKPDTLRYNYPITGLRFYKSGYEVRRTAVKASEKRPRGKRDYITEMSRSSLSKLAFYAMNTSVEFISMMTLTYGKIFPRNGHALRDSRNRFLTALRKKYKGLSYLWFLEFQKRGAPHLHLLLSIFPPLNERQQMGRLWVKAALDFSVLDRDYETEFVSKVEAQMIAVHTHPGRGNKRAAWEQIYSKDGARRYVVKYATKPTQKEVPKDYAKVGRFWGSSRDVKPKLLFTQEATEEDVRWYLGREKNPVESWEVLPKYIFKRNDT